MSAGAPPADDIRGRRLVVATPAGAGVVLSFNFEQRSRWATTERDWGASVTWMKTLAVCWLLPDGPAGALSLASALPIVILLSILARRTSPARDPSRDQGMPITLTGDEGTSRVPALDAAFWSAAPSSPTIPRSDHVRRDADFYRKVTRSA